MAREDYFVSAPEDLVPVPEDETAIVELTVNGIPVTVRDGKIESTDKELVAIVDEVRSYYVDGDISMFVASALEEIADAEVVDVYLPSDKNRIAKADLLTGEEVYKHNDLALGFGIEKFNPCHNQSDGQFCSRGALQPAGNRDEWPEHIKALRLPPAWTNVHVNPDPNGSLQAIGKDAKGRDQYVYSKAFVEAQAAQKFERVAAMAKESPRIEKQIAAARKSSDPIVKEHGDVTYLIAKTGIRPGSDTDTKAATKAYGATTLLGSHVKVERGAVALQFTGKKGVSLDIPVKDREAAAMLKQRKEAAGNGPLFPNVSDSSLRDFVHSNINEGHLKPKDFRTHLGTTSAMKLVDSLPLPKNQAQYKKQVRTVADHVSKQLGNTPTVALQSYIAPQVFATWRMAINVP